MNTGVGKIFSAVLVCWCGCVLARGADTTQPSVTETSLGKISAYDTVKVVVISSDGKHVAFIGVRDGQQWVVRDGVESTPWHWVVSGSLVLSSDGVRCTYVVQNPTDSVAVVDGTALPPVAGIGQNRVALTHAGKHYAFVAQLAGGKGAQVIADGAAGPTYDSIDSPMFSADGTHLAYRATKGAKQCVVLDGKEQQLVDHITDATMVFGPDSKHFAYAVVDGGSSHVMFDTTESPACEKILLGPGFSANGAHLATVVSNAGKQSVVVDGKEQASFDAMVAGDLTFSVDETHFAYGVKRGDKSMVILDGQPQPSFDALGNSTLHFSPDSKHLTYETVTAGKSAMMLDGVKLDAFDGGLVQTPIFSPDSSRILFGCLHDQKWLVVLWDGKQRTELGPFDSVASPSFSPDSKSFAFRCIKEKKLYTDINGTLSPPFEAIGGIVFSPDSRHSVYVARSGGHSHLIIDGVPTTQEFDARLSGEQVDFDGNNSLHLLSIRKGEVFLEQIEVK
jgi:WD40 repeat protein